MSLKQGRCWYWDTVMEGFAKPMCHPEFISGSGEKLL
jgi:hypothetical protein